MRPFFPTLPLKIPYSPGISHWWDPMWWIFQIVVMSFLLLGLRKVAMDIDRARGEQSSDHTRQ
ncbi:MAG: hypothetical protein C7B43_15165 [Sulfobacillus benefaciens]|jgi:hypothetical protein|uniref:Uncharacterized protein n=1 Tax=Sulfobacillus benefaciens TaxID=453960 RepID=A0A2T2WV14_9FIRM|nr:MAG: hypothetical protein C7B43_15165 [Sulfobacillus benefaciens]